MMSAFRCALAVVVGLAVPLTVGAVDFSIELRAQAGKDAKTVQAVRPDATPPSRVLLNAAADTPITLRWTLRNVDKSTTAKDVLVHLFVVREDRLDQAEVPKLTKGVVVESLLTMDFKPQDRTEGEITFRVRAAGCYLIRLELKGAAAKGQREPFAALDLQIR